MNYKPLLPLALGTLLCSAPMQAGTTDGLLIGGMAGLTAGFITSAIARHASHRHHHHHHARTVYVEQPRIVERPVIIEQVIEHRPVVVEQRVRRGPVTVQPIAEPVSQPTPQALQTAPVQIAPTQVAPQAASAPSIQERELALKEQQVKLDLLKEENRQRELKIKELELEVIRTTKKTE